ncbi:MAG TPA: SIR2 family protein [Pyrinomonadaceae bacterium]|nr:SIR2 family protein [Pyrinomonadaceae bacterium]
MQHMIEDLRDSENCDAATLSTFEEALKEGKHLEIALEFKQRTRPDQFAAFLKAELDPPDLIPSRLHEIILNTKFRGIITTNFDVVFESQSDVLEPLVYPQFLEDPSDIQRDKLFVKIHGCIRRTPNLAENLILTQDSYTALRSDRRYRALINVFLLGYRMLTVGFSLRDPDFLGLIDDLREVFGEELPTIYALMLKPDQKARDEWRKRGVQIIPYGSHDELAGFFEEMERLSDKKHPVPTLAPVLKESEIKYEALLAKLGRAQKLEEMYEIVQTQLDLLPSDEQRESFLFQLVALTGRREEIRLAPHLLSLGTPASKRALLAVMRNAVENTAWQSLIPHAKHLVIHTWVLKNWPKLSDEYYFSSNKLSDSFNWLLDKDWAAHGVDLWETFLSLLNRIVSRRKMYELSELYEACQHIEGATERIERVVFAPDFVREDDPQQRWFKNWDLQTRESVRYEKFKRAILNGSIPDYKDQLSQAIQMQVSLPENVYREYAEIVLNLAS